jgi:hypothetical protein
MRSVCLPLLVAAALAAGGCFQMTTLVSVKGDGSGTIDHTMLVTKAALAQLRQFGALAGGRGQNLDLVSEDQARAMATSLGPGVAYISSSPIDTPLGAGRRSTYSFTDITQVRISQQPEPPPGVNIKTQALSTDSGAITCTFTHEANGNAVLHIHLPEPNIPGAGTAAHRTADSPPGDNPLAQQLAMVRVLLAGARILVAVEPAGALVKTSSPYVDGQRVTLLDVNLDQLLGNEAVLAKLQAATNAEEIRAALKDTPGLKITLDREVTIEFTPAK